MKENKNLEFKSAVTNSFLKTVSAYSNFGEGMILFGVNDDGSVCGIKNLQQTCLDLSLIHIYRRVSGDHRSGLRYGKR